MNIFTKLVLTLSFFTLSISTQAQTTIYVDSSVTSSGNGSSWNSAYKKLTEAINYCRANPAVNTIKIAKGTYKPYPHRDSSFVLQKGVSLIGGYSSGGGSRDIQDYPTNLSGDIGTLGDSSDNIYHIMVGNATDSGTIIDGVTITGGNGSDNFTSKDNGAGISVSGGSITINNCTFTKNLTDNSGAAIYVADASISANNCIFAYNKGNMYGGAICIESQTASTSTQILNCTFKSNIGNVNGGAISITNYKGQFDGFVRNCRFSANAINNIFATRKDSGSLNLNIDHCTFESDTNSIGNILLSNTNKTSNLKFNITNSIFRNMIFALYIQNKWSTSLVDIQNCIFDSINGPIIHENTSGTLYETYRNCEFKNFLGLDYASTSQYGILGKTYFNFENCKYTSLPDSNARIRIGSYYDSIQTESVFSNCLFNNTFISSSTDSWGSVLNTFNNCTFFANRPMTCVETDFKKKTQNSHTFNNCIIWQSDKESFTDHYNKLPHDKIILNNCIVKGDTSGEHIITNGTHFSSMYPQFVDTTNYPYNLRLTSCSYNAINRGDSNLMPFGLIIDLDSASRIKQNQVDLGVYESDYTNNLDKIFSTKDSICKSDTLSLSVNYYKGVLHWQEKTSSLWTDIGNGSNPYTNIIINTPQKFRAYLSTGCYDTSNEVTISILPRAIGGTLTANKDTIRAGDSVELYITNYAGHMQLQEDTGTGWHNIGMPNIKILKLDSVTATSRFRAYATGKCNTEYSDTVTIFVSKSLGIKLPTYSDIKVFPIPFSDHIKVLFEGKAHLKLTDLQGRLIYSGTALNNTTINAQGMAPGIYILVLETSQGSKQFKLLKE